MIISEPKPMVWGGPWTEQKLDAFEKYVNAYLTIMNKYRDRYDWKLVYFDGFAGSGSRQSYDDNKQIIKLFEEDINPLELKVYMGAAERVLNIQQRGFDYYYFIDVSQDSCRKLKEKLDKHLTAGKLMEFRANDVNEEIIKLAHAFKQRTDLAGLVFLDPFGMQINWSSIELLAGTRIDLWILIPTGTIINRLLDRKANLVLSDKLESFFGLSIEEIKSYFYNTKTEQTLFGEIKKIQKIEEPIQKIAALYIERLKTIFEEVADNPLVMRNSKNVPIYHFAFASNNIAATKIAGQIIKAL
jgi:three-Cys-motif partner protein